MKVICFYWQGDRWQQHGYTDPEGHVNRQAKTFRRWGQMNNRLPVQYINNLYYGVRRHYSGKFEFICFTNEDLVGLDKNIEFGLEHIDEYEFSGIEEALAKYRLREDRNANI